jgi:predicted DNA-binding protein (MmcQ/YjbR family)
MQHDTTLQERTATRAEGFPGAELTHPSGADWEVWKVGGKVFMLQTAMPGEPVVILKADPADAESLREAHADITPGYHMNKKHWITLHPGGRIDPGLVDDLVTESYLLVVAGLPKRQRPVDPETFRLAQSVFEKRRRSCITSRPGDQQWACATTISVPVRHQ